MGLAAPALGGIRCLVLGANGFLGSAVATALCDAGATVHGFGRAAPNPDACDPRVRWSGGALSDPASLARAVAGQEIVFHLLGSAVPELANRNPAEDLEAHVFWSLKMLEVCRTARVRKVVFASSGGTVYGIPAVFPTPETAPAEPISAYGISKLTIERYLALYLRLHGLDYHVLRIGNAYGPGQSPLREQGVVAATMLRALSGKAIEIWGSGETTRDFIYVDDVAAAFVQIPSYSGPERVMNVGSGDGRSVNAVVSDVKGVLDLPGAAVVHHPERRAGILASILDTALIRSRTAWRPQVAWLDGLERTAAWIRRSYGL